jgi:hypothetical protein
MTELTAAATPTTSDLMPVADADRSLTASEGIGIPYPNSRVLQYNVKVDYFYTIISAEVSADETKHNSYY